MERYSRLQTMPNSPLTPLTPLSENTKFEFNFGGDGSLDMYIDSVRQEHLVEEQQKKLLQQTNKVYHKKGNLLQPKRYSEEFLKIRDVFEAHDQRSVQMKLPNYQRNHRYKSQKQEPYNVNSKVPTVKITHTITSPMPTKSEEILDNEYAATPTNRRTPLKPCNHNIQQYIHSKSFHTQEQQKLQQKCLDIKKQQPKLRKFRQASPISVPPLCPQVAKILRQHGLSIYCSIFQREEIDFYTFHLLKLQDLHQMGITNQKHCAILMHDIYYAGQYF